MRVELFTGTSPGDAVEPLAPTGIPSGPRMMLLLHVNDDVTPQIHRTKQKKAGLGVIR